MAGSTRSFDDSLSGQLFNSSQHFRESVVGPIQFGTGLFGDAIDKAKDMSSGGRMLFFAAFIFLLLLVIIKD